MWTPRSVNPCKAPGVSVEIDSPGEVYNATVTEAVRSGDVGRVFAMKKAPVTNHVRHPMLLHEACALVLLRGVLKSLKSAPWKVALTHAEGHQDIRAFPKSLHGEDHNISNTW